VWAWVVPDLFPGAVAQGLFVNFRPEWGHRFSAKMVHSHERRNGNSWE
jgi:hypothetical protein